MQNPVDRILFKRTLISCLPHTMQISLKARFCLMNFLSRTRKSILNIHYVPLLEFTHLTALLPSSLGRVRPKTLTVGAVSALLGTQHKWLER